MILKNSKIGVSSEELSVRSLIYFIMELRNLFDYIGNYLLDVEETISVAESVTSGFLQFSFSQMKEASKFYKGGITAYTLDEKVHLLHVDEAEASSCDCVSPNIAETMALSVAKSFKNRLVNCRYRLCHAGSGIKTETVCLFFYCIQRTGNPLGKT